MGRWPSGAPLVLSPERDDPALGDANDFGYHAVDGSAWPARSGRTSGAPIRATPSSPRRARERSLGGQPPAPAAAPRPDYSGYPGPDGRAELGIHFICLNANLARQYEFVQHSWINNPAFNGLDDEDRPADRPRVRSRRRSRNPRRATAAPPPRAARSSSRCAAARYFFLPGIRALRYLASEPRWE